MGKKAKIGKQRRDKFYQLAKETGYRARSAFKLIQLNRKFEFLQKCRAVVDLCAAPGGWCQVASQNMRPSSLIVGVDLVAMKPMPGVITLQGDITTDKTRSDIVKTLQGWNADCVLHDGAPNVGKSWVHDAFQQAVLTLHALKLATSILRKGGWFVTKVFRSNDYLALINVFGKLFRKVHATKPQASRNESAEIFVCCSGYLKPDKIDPALLDSKLVFKELNADPEKETFNELQKEKRRKKAALGYSEDSAQTGLLYSALKASQFMKSDNHLELLSNAHQIVIDDERYLADKATTGEVLACLADIKVLGKKSLREILTWRRKLRRSIIAKDEKKAASSASQAMDTNDNDDEQEKEPVLTEEDEEDAELDRQIAEAKGEEKRVLKKKKRKMLKMKALKRKKAELQMEIAGDRPDIPEDLELFKLSTLNTKKKLAATHSTADDDALMDQDDDDDGHESDPLEFEEDMDNGDEEEEQHPLLHDTHTLLGSGKQERVNDGVKQWFGRSTFNDLIVEDDEGQDVAGEEEGDEDDAGADIDETEEIFLENMYAPKTKRDKRKEKKKVKLQKADAEKQSAFVVDQTAGASDSDSDAEKNKDEDDDFEVVPSTATSTPAMSSGAASSTSAHNDNDAVAKPPSKKRVKLSAEALAMGEKLVHSSKTRRDLLDFAYNRYTNNDENLPDWFAEDERKHWRAQLPVQRAVVNEYRDREKELNVRPIKKVAEAKMRKKKRMVMKLNKARKRAEVVVENEELSSQEKRRQLQKLYEKVKNKKPEVKYVRMKKGKRGTMSRPRGPYKMVDTRMKKDMRSAKAKEKTKGRSGSKSRGRPNASKSKGKGGKAGGGKKK